MSHHSGANPDNPNDTMNFIGLGTTGKFPDGKLNKDDEGEIRIAIGIEENNVVMRFGKNIYWIGFEPKQAFQIAASLIDKAKKLGTEDKNPTPSELPCYLSHKRVWALKIKKVILDSDIAQLENRETTGGATIYPVRDMEYQPFKVNAEYVRKHNPKEGGYYVLYEDGYTSYSPAEAFENGYTEI